MANPLDSMTERPMEVLGLIAQGLNNTEIADKLFIAPRTVAQHINVIYSTLHLTEDNWGHARVRAVLAYQQEPQIANARIRLIDKIDELLDEVRNKIPEIQNEGEI